MSRLSAALRSTKNVFATRWNPKEVKIPSWVITTLMMITIIRSGSYGVELLFVVTNSPISQMMAFAAIFGIQLWGILMLASIATLIIGLATRRTLIISIGSLLNAAVWISFSVVLGFGYVELHTGGRFVVAAMATGLTWAVFFWVQLKSLKSGASHA